jgi:hypothetical protein
MATATHDKIVVEFNDKPGKYGIPPDQYAQDKQLEEYEKQGYEIDYDACRVKFKQELVETCRDITTVGYGLRRVTYYTFVLRKGAE